MPRTYRIQRIPLDGEVDVTVPDAVTPLITPDGTAIIIVEDVTPNTHDVESAPEVMD